MSSDIDKLEEEALYLAEAADYCEHRTCDQNASDDFHCVNGAFIQAINALRSREMTEGRAKLMTARKSLLGAPDVGEYDHHYRDLLEITDKVLAQINP